MHEAVHVGRGAVLHGEQRFTQSLRDWARFPPFTSQPPPSNLTSPTGVITAAVPQANTSVSTPLFRSRSQSSMLIVASSAT